MKRVIILLLLILPGVLANGYGEYDYDDVNAPLGAIGIALIGAGVAYYAMTKRKFLVKYRKGPAWDVEISPEKPYMTIIGPVTPLRIHHFLTVGGTALAFVHFLSCPDRTSLPGQVGLAIALVLILENVLGFAGVAIRKRIPRNRKWIGIYRAWKVVHMALAVLLAVLVAVHVSLVD